MKKYKFNKEAGVWYIDLPAFIDAKLGTKANLMMVAGADTLLDTLSNNKNTISLIFDEQPFDGFTDTLIKTGIGKDQQVLDSYNHPQVEYGAYYTAVERNHNLWLCPVTEYVFNGHYPNKIYIKKED